MWVGREKEMAMSEYRKECKEGVNTAKVHICFFVSVFSALFAPKEWVFSSTPYHQSSGSLDASFVRFNILRSLFTTSFYVFLGPSYSMVPSTVSVWHSFTHLLPSTPIICSIPLQFLVPHSLTESHFSCVLHSFCHSTSSKSAHLVFCC